MLHPNLGVVISADAIVGRDLLLTGGNVLGTRPGSVRGELVLGDRVGLGANAVVLGPAVVGDGVVVGAGAVLLGDAAPGTTVVGQPARPTSASVGSVAPGAAADEAVRAEG